MIFPFKKKRKFFAICSIFSVFFELCLSGCASSKKMDNPWEMEDVVGFTNRVLYEKNSEKPFPPEMFETHEFIFLRLLTNEYRSENGITKIWKKMIESQGVAPDGMNYNHAEINTDLNDVFVGLTAWGDNATKLETIMAISDHPYLYKMDPDKAICSVFALPVSAVDRKNCRYLLDFAISGEKKFVFYVPDIINMPSAHSYNERRWKKIGEVPWIEGNEQELVLPAEKYFDDVSYICSGFVAYVLKQSVKSVRNQFYIDETNIHAFTVSDLLRLPGIQKLFTCTYNDYEQACRSYVYNNPEWKKYAMDEYAESDFSIWDVDENVKKYTKDFIH